MKNEIMPFEHPAFGKVRVITDETTGEPWFVAKDVCEALGYMKPENATATHCRRTEKMTTPKQGGQRGGAQFLTIIPESDLYRLIIRSKLPAAERFEAWVMEEVLPAIRKHGGYLTPSKVEEALLNPDTIIKLATALKEERAARQAAQAELAEVQPKALFR